MQILRARSLAKSFRKKRVVDDVSLEVHEGEVVGLLGPNGAGKTTTFDMVVGLTRPESGSVFLNNEEITELPMYLRARGGINYLPQEPSIFRKLTVEENVLAILETLDLKPGEELPIRTFHPSTLQIISLTITPKAPAPIKIGGQEIECFECQVDPIQNTFWISKDGRFVRAKQADLVIELKEL